MGRCALENYWSDQDGKRGKRYGKDGREHVGIQGDKKLKDVSFKQYTKRRSEMLSRSLIVIIEGDTKNGILRNLL